MNNVNMMLVIMAYLRAIHNTAKLYHWEAKGLNFYEDHLFFDRVADTFNEDLVDKIAENYFMLTDCTEPLQELPVIQYEIESRFNKCILGTYYKAMYDLIEECLEKAEDYNNSNGVRSINVLLDEVAITCTSILALLSPRLDVGEVEMQTSRENDQWQVLNFHESSQYKSAMKEGFVNAYIKELLGIPSETLLTEAYNSRRALLEDVTRITNDHKRARTLLMAGGNMPEDCKAEDEKLLSDM